MSDLLSKRPARRGTLAAKLALVLFLACALPWVFSSSAQAVEPVGTASEPVPGQVVPKGANSSEKSDSRTPPA